MKKYKIKKISKNYDNSLCDMSDFGDSQEFFVGFSNTTPIAGERFVLYDEIGRIVINTSKVVDVVEDKITTVYSIYQIEEL